MAENITYIIFSKSIDNNSVETLMNTILAEIQSGRTHVHILISSPGGQVTPGLAIYNFLKGIPIEISTQAFGQVDSMAVILLCAGSNRYSTPESRFLIHGIGFNASAGARFDERSLKERLESITNERETISNIISENSERSLENIENDMLTGVVWTPEMAEEYGLISEIRTELFPRGARVIKI